MSGALQRILAASLVIACTAAVGCGSNQPHGDKPTAVLRVTEKDFKISAPASMQAGDAQLDVHNIGPDDHELIVVRTPAGKALPMRADGITVDEDAVKHATAAAIEPQPPNGTKTVGLHLTPGRYTLFCNMSGHYRGGMRRVLIVR
jgi:uncharacterized cupredoxin-like copper-binding protein